MSNYQHTFTLRQHTPMIHFQADEEGAFVRVSELKPAFDRYLWEKVWTPEDDIESKAEMLICYTDAQREEIIKTVKEKNYQWDDWSLNYSVEIEDINESKRKISNIDKFPCYFADLGKAENKPKFVFYEPDFSIKFTCFDETLLKVIIQYFPTFLSRTNFGARKSKGFGSFTVIDTLSQSPILPKTTIKGLYSFEVKNMDDKTFRALFEHIDLFWKVLRNGIDVPLKIPSALGKWVDSKGLHFDKSTLKKYVDNSINKNATSDQNTKKNILYRDLLGLASTTEWHFQRITMDKTSTNTEQKIDRIMSPILIKPIRQASSSNYTVYLVVPLLNNEVLSKEFRIELKNKSGNIGLPTTFKTSNDATTLRLFMDYAVGTYKNTFLADYKRDNRPDVNKIKVVFGSLRKITQP
ncbi:hypothetical protein VB264_21220 [Arcicella aquatica]|uniref:Uncharacterized protein n=1 Tax=Arcicella aquatica TaxID=217141 RepID=A0ABU5QUD4_9BACT|nr:hypothetical protein [Arcicella aquatica]MEA5260334.1 hypothetical protein [Arcicella aquatica]